MRHDPLCRRREKESRKSRTRIVDVGHDAEKERPKGPERRSRKRLE